MAIIATRSNILVLALKAWNGYIKTKSYPRRKPITLPQKDSSSRVLLALTVGLLPGANFPGFTRQRKWNPAPTRCRCRVSCLRRK